jgi:hypothetical protein
MEVACLSEMLVSVYKTALRHIQEQHGLDLLQYFPFLREIVLNKPGNMTNKYFFILPEVRD